MSQGRRQYLTTSGQPDADRGYGWLGGKQRSGDAIGDTILMGVRLYTPGLGRFLQPDPVPGGSATTYDYCNADPINCTDLDGNWSWKKVVGTVAKVASVASMIPGPIGAIAGVVSAVAYAATGNWKEAAWALAGAAAAVVGAGAAVKGAKIAVNAVRASRAAKAGTAASKSARGCLCKCNSFTPDTQVLMADGTTKAIAEIKIFDTVLAADPETGETGARAVTVLHENLDVDFTDVTIQGGDGESQTIHTTQQHPFWSVTRSDWVYAASLTPGEQLTNAAGTSVTVTNVRSFDGWRLMYNLTVDDIHTYYVVVDSESILVHNVQPCLPGPKHRAPSQWVGKHRKISGLSQAWNGNKVHIANGAHGASAAIKSYDSSGAGAGLSLLSTRIPWLSPAVRGSTAAYGFAKGFVRSKYPGYKPRHRGK